MYKNDLSARRYSDGFKLKIKVFDEFYRASNVLKDMKAGTGLGLSIAKQVVEDHKGRIWVNSETGIWTKFSFIIPANPEEIR